MVVAQRAPEASRPAELVEQLAPTGVLVEASWRYLTWCALSDLAVVATVEVIGRLVERMVATVAPTFGCDVEVDDEPRQVRAEPSSPPISTTSSDRLHF
jgi:hypothetical protein